MIKKNIVVISVPDDKNVEGENGCSPPLGCVRVASAAKQAGANEKFIDGQHYTTVSRILEQVPSNTELVGISFNRISIPNVRPLILGLLERGVKRIIAGGQAVIPVSEAFVKDFADPRIIACTGDGEPTIQGIVGGNPLQKVLNLIYFENGELKRTPDELIDYKTLNLEEQVNGFGWENYFEYAKNFFGHRRSSAYFTDGCPRRSKTRGCSFCARRRTGSVRSVTSEQAYNHLKFLKEQGAEQVNINDDTFFGNLRFVEGLVKQYQDNGDLDLGLHVYGCVSELTQRNLNLAERIGIRSVLVGIESGDEKIRRINGKPISDEQIFETAQSCKDRGIAYEGAFIIGLIGETEDSVRATVDLVRKLSEGNFSSKTYASLFMPYAGSWAHSKIRKEIEGNSTLQEKYRDQFSRWDYSWSVLADAQLEINTCISRDRACKALEQIKEISVSTGTKSIVADYSKNGTQ